MHSIGTVEITGYGNRNVPNTFFRQQETTGRLAIVLPGIGYTCQMPLLYYPSRIAAEIGMDVLWVEYNYTRDPDFHALTNHLKNDRLFSDVDAAIQVALAQRNYDGITLIGKSMGTQAISAWCRLTQSPSAPLSGSPPFLMTGIYKCKSKPGKAT